MKYKRIRFYRGSPDPLRAIEAVQPRWRFEWRDGPPPAPCGVYCDEDWRPIFFTTKGGRRLPNLQAAQEAEEVRDG